MPDQQEIRPGHLVGEYRLMSELGGGSFGKVYLAEHVHKQTHAAVKVLSLPQTEVAHLKAFINEARTMRLRHPHIVPLLDFGISRNDLPFLVMEYAQQGTLRDRHPKGERVPLSTVVSYVDQLASGLQYAHDHYIIHRDVKPENILVRADGTLMVSDFGIAKFLEQSLLISQQKLAGTPEYMAPEQYTGIPCFASDQYALGVIVYEWICGVRPFQGTVLNLAVQHISTPPQELRNHLPALPEAVEHVILKALAKAPLDRFGCVQEMASALREAVGSVIGFNPAMEARDTAPPIAAKLASPSVSDSKLEIKGHTLTTRQPAHTEPAMQKADVPLSDQVSSLARHSAPPEMANHVASPPQSPSVIRVSAKERAKIGQSSWSAPNREKGFSRDRRRNVLLALFCLVLLLGGATWLVGEQWQGHVTDSPAVPPQASLPKGRELYSTTMPAPPACNKTDDGWQIFQIRFDCFSTSLHISGPSAAPQLGGSLLNRLPGGQRYPNDYVVQAHLQSLQLSTFGLSFRTQPGYSLLGTYAFLVSPDGTWRANVYDHTTGIPKQLTGGTQTLVSGTRTWATLAVVVKGAYFSFYINNTLVGTAQDTTYSSGRAGIVVDQNGEIATDQFSLYAPKS